MGEGRLDPHSQVGAEPPLGISLPAPCVYIPCPECSQPRPNSNGLGTPEVPLTNALASSTLSLGVLVLMNVDFCL